MRVGRKDSTSQHNAYRKRSKQALDYAVDQIRKSPLAPYVRAVYVFGSYARNEETFRSDVDLLLELDQSFDMERGRGDIVRLKSHVNPQELSLPEVDLKIVQGPGWRDSQELFYQNVRRDGENIWNPR